MKNYKKFLIVIFAIATISCNENILQEKPLDFLSPENSYTTPGGIESALFRNYSYLKNFYNGHADQGAYIHVGTDLCTSARNSAIAHWGDYSTLTVSSGIPQSFWSTWYKVIYNCNVIINRIDGVKYASETDKSRHMAEARFFRGYAYKILANLFGGVPIVLTEITEPKRDFVRASKEEVYNQAIDDIVYAAQHLPGVTQVAAPGRLNNAAANHILSELYISVGQWDKAIAAATLVINDPNIKIMTTRFGKRASNEGDPYWDLFQVGNVNRGNGNLEGILVLQDEFNIPGGTDPLWYAGTGLYHERSYGPLFWQLADPKGVQCFDNKPYTQVGGRPVGLVRPTNYFSYKIWDTQNWSTDIRNNNRNIMRDWKVTNPKSTYFGQYMSNFKQAFTAQDTLLKWYPYVSKCTTINDHPAAVIANAATGELIGTAGKTFNDWYLIRVSETYLLRAEAYLGKGDKTLAAADINVIRNRAVATPVTVAAVTIDYILDERMRELNYEEGRRMTLGRLNKIYDRTVLGNEFAGKTIKPFNNLFPIPFNEIERNTGAVLVQNPGYN